MSEAVAAERIPAGLEMTLRLLPRVVGVVSSGAAGSGDISVLVAERSEQLAAAVDRAVDGQAPGIGVVLVEIQPFGAPGSSSEARPSTAVAERVALDHAAFDRASGVAEVVLSLGTMRATGSAAGTPLIGGVLATLKALRGLDLAVPFSLAAVDHLGTAHGAPVVVCLRPERSGEERIGVARNRDDCEAAGRATLSALNRHLSDSLASAASVSLGR